jgi:hypothetical protein
MNTAFVPTVDHAVLSDSLRETFDRLSRFREAARTRPGVFGSDVNWLEIYDILDRVRDQPAQVIRPAPRPLVDAYVRTRAWLREIHSRLRCDPADKYALRQLDILITRLERELLQHTAP